MAKKYIDAQKLKEDIQANLAAISFNDDYQEGYEACGMSVLKSIESLQQEQSEVDLEKEIDKEWKKCNPVDEGMGVESAYMHIEAFDIIARHFAKWGAEHLKK